MNHWTWGWSWGDLPLHRFTEREMIPQIPDKCTFGSRNFLSRTLGSSLTESVLVSCWSGSLVTSSSRSGEDFCPLRTTHGAGLELFQIICLGGCPTSWCERDQVLGSHRLDWNSSPPHLIQHVTLGQSIPLCDPQCLNFSNWSKYPIKIPYGEKEMLLYYHTGQGIFPWCWERLKAKGEGDSRGWDG